jgi:hypothetical protein
MTGQIRYTAAQDESVVKTADGKLGKAFCAGRHGLINGANINPHVSGDELYAAYEAGYATVTPEGSWDNCAMAIPITMPNLVGMDQATATAAIIAAGLAVGKITGDFGVVTAQLPASAAKTQPNDVVTLTQKVTVPDLTGLTSANAEAALIAAHLIKGVVTGTSGVVTTQLPLAAALAVSGSAVAYTIA